MQEVTLDSNLAILSSYEGSRNTARHHYVRLKFNLTEVIRVQTDSVEVDVAFRGSKRV